MSRRFALIFLAALCGCALLAPAADARKSAKKSIWGPVRVNGVSQFPRYNDLGVGIFQIQLQWQNVAPTRPANPADFRDPAYRWPATIDDALREARRYRMRVSVMLIGTPMWANGGRSWRRAPDSEADFAAFAGAASRRYPGVALWQIWGEPNSFNNFRPQLHALEKVTLTSQEADAPRRYARLLDGAYAALKAVQRSDLVIGGSTWTAGSIFPYAWIRYMRLPNGRPPRMDLYGHNPFTGREPNMRNPPSPGYRADFSDMGRLAAWIDRYLGRQGGRRTGPRIKLFLSEFVIPTAPDKRFNFWTTRNVQAFWLRQALGISRGWYRIYTLGWLELRDDPRNRSMGGLIDSRGRRKPSYRQFKIG